MSALSEVVWIPTTYAVVGRVPAIAGDDDVWTDGWIVRERFETRDETWLRDHERDHLKQRQASDI